MITFSLIVSLALASPQKDGLLAIRVGRAETVSQGPIEHAVILVENGKIVEIGEDLLVERGIPVLDRPEWVATPGLVDCHSRSSGERYQGRAFEPQLTAAIGLDPTLERWKELLELGVTTIGFYPDGGGIPGRAVAIKPHGDTAQEMLVDEEAYLKVFLQATAASKKMLREAFEKVDEYEEKVAKEREKWEKEQEKKKSKSKSKKDDDKKEEAKKDEKKDEKKEEKEDTSAVAQDPPEEKPKDEEEEKKDEKGEDKKADSKAQTGDVFVPPEPDEKVKPLLDLRHGRLSAMMSIRKAADYVHLVDVIEKEKDARWFLHSPLQDDLDLFEVALKIGEKKLLVVTEPEVTLQPHSLRLRNIPAELVRAGAKVALLPREDSVKGHEDWLKDVGRLIAQGLPREAALAAVTLEGARALGLETRLGSLEKEKDANIVFWNGDPFEPASRVQAVMLEGRIVHEVER